MPDFLLNAHLDISSGGGGGTNELEVNYLLALGEIRVQKDLCQAFIPGQCIQQARLNRTE